MRQNLHPFEDGNGRIARAVTPDPCPGLRSGIPDLRHAPELLHDQSGYYQILEQTQKGSMDVTPWICWFLEILKRSVGKAARQIAVRTWIRQHLGGTTLDSDQRKIISMLLEGLQGKLTAQKWARICKCSPDAAAISVRHLVALGVLAEQDAGKSAHYILAPDLMAPEKDAGGGRLTGKV